MKLNLETLKRNKWRYLGFIFGFLFFVYPFAAIPRIIYFLQGSLAAPTLHSVCYRMTVEWMFTGRYWTTIIVQPIRLLALIAIVVAFFFGPLFCGWLCPIGSLTESLSRLTPRRLKIDFSGKVSLGAIRYGFFIGFLLPAILGMIGPATPVLGSCCAPEASSVAETLGIAGICCRYCAASSVQNIVDFLTGNFAALTYWHTGGIITMVFWLFIGGIFLFGGRGWCWVCPLGVLSNAVHYIGTKLGFTYKVKHDPTKCKDCGQCRGVCPSWAIKPAEKSVSIDRHACTVCKECVTACSSGALTYSRGHEDVKAS
ncbi:MAG: 4Fe-4S binding protein [Candidatus Bathyarchaeota archaeon]|nr:MAG: 4Fe-4S binding protein [Candidatus Bathyarchaeota archaeon]